MNSSGRISFKAPWEVPETEKLEEEKKEQDQQQWRPKYTAPWETTSEQRSGGVGGVPAGEEKKEEEKKEESPEEVSKKIQDLKAASLKILFRTKNFFPFDLFPDEIIIDLNKVSILVGEFFDSKRAYSIPVTELADVVVENGPIFATIRIFDNRYKEHPISVSYLKKGDAIKIRKIIEGLIISNKKKIDLTKLKDQPNITEIVEDIGRLGAV